MYNVESHHILWLLWMLWHTQQSIY